MSSAVCGVAVDGCRRTAHRQATKGPRDEGGIWLSTCQRTSSLPPGQPHRSGSMLQRPGARSERWDHGSTGTPVRLEATAANNRSSKYSRISRHQRRCRATTSGTAIKSRRGGQLLSRGGVAFEIRARSCCRSSAARWSRAPREKGLIDRATRFDFALQFAQRRMLVGPRPVLLESVEIGLERFFARLRALKLAARRGCDIVSVLIDSFCRSESAHRDL